MIYVFWDYERGENDEPVKIIKIGFTEDWKQRRIAHKSLRPRLKVLFTIEGGTELDEKNIHQFFKDFKFYNCRELFYYCDEIIQFFQENSKIEEIREVVPQVVVISERNKTFLSSHQLQIIAGIISRMNNLGYDNYERVFSNITNAKAENIEQLRDYFNENGYNADRVIEKFNKLENSRDSLSKESKEFLTRHRDGNWNKAMKDYCRQELSDSVRDEVKDYIPYWIEYFYNFLGVKVCKSTACQKNVLVDKYHIETFPEDVLKDAIYNEFSVGCILPRGEVKKRISSLYQKIGYKKTAKANDIEKWFKTKRKVFIIGGKQNDGYELLQRLST